MLAGDRCHLVCTKEKALQSMAQHCKAWHSTEQQDPARHSTALRRAVELAKLNGALLLWVFLCFQLYAAGCHTKKNFEPAPTETCPRPSIAWSATAWGTRAWVTSARLG